MHEISSSRVGTLHVVATPIGNLDDITLRALDVLKHVDVILAEDTRHTRSLLAHHGIGGRLVSLHDHNERARVQEVTARLGRGESLALVTDAGTPLISDPGYFLVREVIGNGYRVVPVPGATALVAALSAAGLPTDRFVFEGFLSARRPGRLRQLEGLSTEERTLIFYESPRRLGAFLEDAVSVFGGERRATLARELTKVHETFHTGVLGDLLHGVTVGRIPSRGEFVVCIEGTVAGPVTEVPIQLHSLVQALISEVPVKSVVRIAHELTGAKRNIIYALALSLSEGE